MIYTLYSKVVSTLRNILLHYDSYDSQVDNVHWTGVF